MSQRRITSIEKDGVSWVFTGQLGDGTPDEDGQILDPRWLEQAAIDWMMTSPLIHTSDPRQPAGIALSVWQQGDTTGLRGRIVSELAARWASDGARGGAVPGLTLGIISPSAVADPVAPMGRITSGKLVRVGLDDAVTRDDKKSENSG